MNGFVRGTWLADELEKDMQREGLSRPGVFTLAHNVASQSDVQPLIGRLVVAGGTELRTADASPHGGYGGYVADPDGHAWVIAFNPAWTIDEQGHVTFGI